MLEVIQLGMFSAKLLILFLFILAVLLLFLGLLAKGKQKERLCIKNISRRNEETKEALLTEILSKKELKQFYKEQKAAEKNNHHLTKNIYVLNFHGDIKASAVNNLSEEITAVLNIAKPSDEVVVRLESAGGVVHGYGLAAAQLMRLRAHDIPLTITIDKVAASGGYMMACVANKVLAAPFAIVGSIGVIVQLPNFNRLLKENNIDFEQQTAGEFKRTLTVFGPNTDEGREKLQSEIEKVHQSFKTLIQTHRPQLDIAKVATGEHWLGQEALALNLVDEIKTSAEYLLEASATSHVFEITYETKKSMLTKLMGGNHTQTFARILDAVKSGLLSAFRKD